MKNAASLPSLNFTRHLRAFHEVCLQGSVSGAAHSLRRAQSAVTRAILQLESAVGAALFERSVRGMQPTEAGQQLLRRVQRAYAHMEQVRNHLSPARHHERHAEIYALHMAERRLRALLEVARRQHVGAAARALGLSQPAVSHLINEVETRVGTRLFERSARGLHPTPAGELLARQLQLALNELRIAVEEIAALRGLEQGEVRVGTLSLGRTHLLPAAVTHLLAHHPTLHIVTMEGDFSVLAAALRAGEIDFILGALRPPEHCQGLLREPFLDDTLSLLVRTGHPLSQCQHLTMHALMEASWVLPQTDTPTRSLFEAALSARGLNTPPIAVETADLSLTRELLLESDMLTAASIHQFHRELEAGLLVSLPILLTETVRQIGILRRSNDSPSPSAQLLIQSLQTISSRLS